MDITPVKRALISVSDKTGIVDFAKQLQALSIEIISTGGTSQLLREAGIPHQQVDEVTGLPEMLGGRVKTLHPLLHGGILGKRDKHAEEAKQHHIHWIDLVIVNFYPFAKAINENKKMTWSEVVEYIDIGGPTMVRAAAKNFAWVGVITDIHDYGDVITELQTQKGLSNKTRETLAKKAFGLTAHYDAVIQQYFLQQSDMRNDLPEFYNVPLKKSLALRYGENPHQQACAYQNESVNAGILNATLHQGKPLSYNNILDAEASLACLAEFTMPACVIVKHANPCGVAIDEDITSAYQKAYQADALSAFGGIVALNRECNAEIATAITSIFMEVVIATGYTQEALTIFASKPNLRILSMAMNEKSLWELKYIAGGALLQEKDLQVITQQDLQMVTKRKPTDVEIKEMLFAWPVLKHIKSNGILIAKNNATVGIGAGQVSRIDSVEIAIRKAGNNIEKCILASDAFFPFRDSIDKIAHTGICAIIQPGGSVRDPEVIAACDEFDIAMVFTGKRCFRH